MNSSGERDFSTACYGFGPICTTLDNFRNMTKGQGVKPGREVRRQKAEGRRLKAKGRKKGYIPLPTYLLAPDF